MYDFPEITEVTDRFWAGIRDGLRAAGIDAPQDLTRDGDPWSHWQSPDLVLSQTCGLPFRARLHDKVTLVGTPDYALPDCPHGHYNSVALMRADDTRTAPADWPGLRLAYNEAMSQSGWAAASAAADGHGTRFGGYVASGGHRASIAALLDGTADIAFVDAQTWRMVQRHAPVSGLAELARTAPTPGLPYIAGPGADAPAIFEAVTAAIAALDATDCDALGIAGLCHLPVSAYRAMPDPAPPPGAIG